MSESYNNFENRNLADEGYLNENDYAILDRVEGALADGLALKSWWEKTHVEGTYESVFEIVREYNKADDSFGFFDSVTIPQGEMPVMGTVDESVYDYTKHAALNDVRDEFREFVLRYFMRISDYHEPQAYGKPRGRTKYLTGVSWCPQKSDSDRGFGFTQHYYKLRETGEIGKFNRHDSNAIVDLREIGDKYEWIVLKVRIFNFNVNVPVPGTQDARVVIPLLEESYLVVNRDFVYNEESPEENILGRYGFGYAFIRSPETGLLAYGPGEFNAAIELIRFELTAEGEIRARLVFLVNRPDNILNVTFDPVDLGFRAADFFSFGMSNIFFAPFRSLFEDTPFRISGIDPLGAYVTAANGLSGGAAAEEFCISHEQLEKTFLVQHFMQHYQMLVGSLLTWRRIPNWLDTAALPESVITGRFK